MSGLERILVVRSEDDLWRFLDLSSANWTTGIANAGLAPYTAVKIDGWNPELLYFPDEPRGHTISPTVAKSIQDFHQSLSRAYALLAYGEPRAKLLHAEDREALDFRARVTDGSSGVQLVSDGIQQIVNGLIDKMTGEQMVLSIAILAVTFMGTTLGRYYIKKMYDEKRDATATRELLALSEQETRRTEIMASLVAAHPRYIGVQDEADDAKDALLRSASRATRSRVLGTDVDADVACTALSKIRERGEGRPMEGRFKFISVESEHDGGFVAHVRSYPDNAEFSADINRMELAPEDIATIDSSLWDEKIVRATINAWYVGDRVTRSSVVKARPDDQG